MDQSISCLAESGVAKYVSFNPLKTASVKLPKGGTFVVANCMKTHSLTGTGGYNLRVVECRLAAILLAKKLGFDDWKGIKTLQDTQNAAASTGAKVDAAQMALRVNVLQDSPCVPPRGAISSPPPRAHRSPSINFDPSSYPMLRPH